MNEDDAIKLASEGYQDKVYQDRIWKKKRLKILSRDNYECQVCKYKKHKLVKANTVHHIVEVKQDTSLFFNDDNLISVCHNCHDEIHGRNKIWKYKKKKRLTEEKW